MSKLSSSRARFHQWTGSQPALPPPVDLVDEEPHPLRQGATKQAQAVHASAIEMIEGVASGLQDQELKQTFLSARPVQEIRERLGHLT